MIFISHILDNIYQTSTSPEPLQIHRHNSSNDLSQSTDKLDIDDHNTDDDDDNELILHTLL